MKIRLKKEQVELSPLELIHEDCFKESDMFLCGCRSYVYSVPHLRSFLSQEYRRVFPSKPYPEGKPLPLVRLAIAYELLRRGYLLSKKPIPAKVEQNWRAAVAFEPQKLEASMQSLTQIQLKQPEGGHDMKTQKSVLVKSKSLKASPEAKAQANAKAKAEAKPARVTVTGKYIELFDRQAKGAKLTDKQLAAEMRKAFPEKKAYDEADIRAVRSLYNNGKLAGQKSKPKQPIEAK